MKIGKCKKCKYFQKADWSNISVEFGIFELIDHKIFRVCGFCMDNKNPDFNYYAKTHGRGISKTKSIFSPKWCRLRNK